MSQTISKPSGIAVLCCDDYDAFHMIKGNRTLDLNKIKKILADIEAGTNLLPYFPILVTKNNEGKYDIIDGQHRFVVTKKIKAPVHFILAENLTLYQIARLNSNTEKWKGQDFIHCYVELGNEHYKMLQQVMKDFTPVPLTSTLMMLYKNTPANPGHDQIMERFQQGSFEALYYDETVAFLSIVKQFEIEGKMKREFLIAISKVIKADVFPVDELIKKVNADPNQLQYHDHWRKYLNNLEEIVSKGKQKRVAIY